MKSHLLKALLATVLLALGLTKASAAFDPSVHNSRVDSTQTAPEGACIACGGTACNYLE